MTVLVDDNRAVEITLQEWNDSSASYEGEWSADFFDTAERATLDGGTSYLSVDDIDYCLEQVNDMIAGKGDFAASGPQPNQTLDVTELDRSLFLASGIRAQRDPAPTKAQTVSLGAEAKNARDSSMQLAQTTGNTAPIHETAR